MKFPKSTLLFVGILLVGCNPTKLVTPPSEPPVAALGNSSSAVELAAVPQEREISAMGIGRARLGMKLGELKQALGAGAEFKVQSPFIVDFDAIAVTQNGTIQFYILYLAGQSFSDQDVIQGLMTENPDYKTAAGVGVGTSIQQAEATYGKATLSYNTANESREYVRFARQPANNISFGTGNGSANPAGIYPSSTGEFNETQQYRPDAAIQSVLVVCLASGCAQ